MLLFLKLDDAYVNMKSRTSTVRCSREGDGRAPALIEKRADLMG